jgi:hypothetical protein
LEQLEVLPEQDSGQLEQDSGQLEQDSGQQEPERLEVRGLPGYLEAQDSGQLGQDSEQLKVPLELDSLEPEVLDY